MFNSVLGILMRVVIESRQLDRGKVLLYFKVASDNGGGVAVRLGGDRSRENRYIILSVFDIFTNVIDWQQ